MIIKALYLLLFFFVVTCISAQDFVITNEQDTLKGSIRSDIFGKPKFKNENGDKYESILSDKVREYYDFKSNKYYISKTLPNKDELVFLERLERGKIEFYELSSKGFSASPIPGGSPLSNHSEQWFASKNKSSLIDIRTNQISGKREERKDAFYDLISDNPVIAKKFLDQDRFSFKQIRKLIIEYNSTSDK